MTREAGRTPALLWRPSPEQVQRSRLVAYARWLVETRGLRIDPSDYQALWRWSVRDLEGFWASIWEYFGVDADPDYERVLGERRMPGAEWFAGAELNYAAHILRGKDPEAVAIRYASETRAAGAWTWRQLEAATQRVAAGMASLGVGRGDRVAAYLPNCPEAVAAFLACASIGAIWSSCSPDFGPGSVIDRFGQIEPKLLITVDGYRYAGQPHDRRAVVDAVRDAVPSVAATVLVDYLGAGLVRDAIAWNDLQQRGADAPLTPAPVAFSHPLWVVYSSGTTGLPKPIVHSHGGILLEQLKTHHLHLDVDASARVFWFTTTGWMMWNFLVGVLLTDASIILYDGSPAHPDPAVLWQLAADTGMTLFGTSASYINACMKNGVRPTAGRDLSALRAVGSTGSPLSPEGFSWVYDALGSATWLFSTSGGTDLCTAFVGGVPTLPVYRGELQARSLGAAIEAWSDDGESLIGQVGELVLTEPMPSMPVMFWNDPNHERYHDAYFSMFPGVWRHGDWIEITPRGTAIIYGRSDATINRGGVRIGSSEIYRAVLGVAQITDALVVDVPVPGAETWMALFVVLRDDTEFDDRLVQLLKRQIRRECSPRHVPDDIYQVREVPRTLSGKPLEVPVKRLLMGETPQSVASRDALANPAAFDWFATFARDRAATGKPPAPRAGVP